MNPSDTPMDPAARKRAQAERHNAARKLKYDTDIEHREARLEKARQQYRERKGVHLPSCLDRIGVTREYGTSRDVKLDGQPVGLRMCFTAGELGEILGDHKASVIYRWQAKGLIPKPVATARVFCQSSGRGGDYWLDDQAVYLEEEVIAMMRPIGEHQRQFKYYRLKDEATTQAVFDAVEAARRSL